MVAMIHNLPDAESLPVTPVDRPTVPKAEICSKSNVMHANPRTGALGDQQQQDPDDIPQQGQTQ